jgi:hypothetical protein
MGPRCRSACGSGAPEPGSALRLGLHCDPNSGTQVDGDYVKGPWHVALAGNQNGEGLLIIRIYADEFVCTVNGWEFKSVNFTPA